MKLWSVCFPKSATALQKTVLRGERSPSLSRGRGETSFAGYRLCGAAKKERENAVCRRKETARWSRSGWRPGR